MPSTKDTVKSAAAFEKSITTAKKPAKKAAPKKAAVKKVPAKKASVKKAAKPESKAEKARAIFKMMKGAARKDVIAAFMKDAGLSKAGASTYFQNIKKENRK